MTPAPHTAPVGRLGRRRRRDPDRRDPDRRDPDRRGLHSWLLAAVAALAVAGCTGISPDPVASPAPQGGTSTTAGDPTSTDEPGAAGVLPTRQELAAARADVAKLDVARLAAQLVVPRQEGSGVQAAAAIRRQHVGGVVAFANVIPAAPERVRPQVSATNRAVHEAMMADGRDWPAFVAVDQEGGSVNRIGAPLTRFPAPMALGAARNPELTTRVALVSGSQLRELGYSVVLAPSADVTAGAADPTIGTRSPGADPARVATVARAQLAGYRQAGMLATLKHFPGHGGVRTDSHLGVARQSAALEVLNRTDLLPFAELAQTAPAVMVGHIQLGAVDARTPATLSTPVVTGLLRTTQKFAGLVVSDALEMHAITDQYGAGEAAVRAIEAGCDVILIPASTDAAISALTAAVASGRLTRARLEESAARMVAALRHAEAVPATKVSPGTARVAAAALAAASITQLDGPCGRPMVTGSITIAGGEPADRAALADAARAAGLGVGSGRVVRLISGGGYQAAGGGGAQARGALAVDAGAARIAGVASDAAGPGGPGGPGGPARLGEIVVALDRPYPLATGRPGGILLATYGRTPATFVALVDVLLGKHKAGGRLPVRVGRYPMGAGCR